MNFFVINRKLFAQNVPPLGCSGPCPAPLRFLIHQWKAAGDRVLNIEHAQVAGALRFLPWLIFHLAPGCAEAIFYPRTTGLRHHRAWNP